MGLCIICPLAILYLVLEAANSRNSLKIPDNNLTDHPELPLSFIGLNLHIY